MLTSQTLGGPSRCGRVLGPPLDKIIKNAAWRKHTHLVSSCKSALDKLETLSDTGLSDPTSPLLGISSADANFVLNPIQLALETNCAKVAEPALECTFKLFSFGLFRGEIHNNVSNPILYKIVEGVCTVGGIGEEPLELGVLRVLLAAIRCPCVLVRGDCLINVVRTCYNIYLRGLSGTNQICAKSVLAQIVLIIFTRAEEDSIDVPIKTVFVSELLEFSDKTLNEGSSIYHCQNFVSEVMNASEGVPDLKLSQQSKDQELQNVELKVSKWEEVEEIGEEETKEGADSGSNGISKIREDGFLVFKNLCKLSMKFSSQENDDQILLRGKTLSLELLKVVMDNGDSQIIVDIFVNYDCDVDSPNIFERIVNGLLKTALGPPPASTTTLSPVQDITFRHESVKCLVSIIKSMGAWMDQKLAVGDSVLRKSFKSDTSLARFSNLTAEDGTVPDFELQQEVNSELSNAATLEQRRAYKIELQKGVSLFNRKPSKGIEFLINTKKVGNSPEEVSSFLKNNTSGLNETMIGDYLGEREEFALKVMHAYVDSFDFKSMDFGEAIRFFLQGFRLPGEAQKIDRIMEKFAERYCKCNPNSFTSADTAYVLAYSVIMLNTDAHNSMVKEKMTKYDFIRNNQGVDDGKDLPDEYLCALYDQIVKNEIKMNADSSVPQSFQANSLNKLLGLDGILNLVTWKQAEEKALGANGFLIRQIQEQFKAKSGKSESVYHSVSDVAILRFMVEVCWGPMLAAFSVTLDQSDDRIATTQCLLGFRHAVHVTAAMGMQTQRDAFVTSTAKFTFLHCAADMKQKNVDAVKAIISIAIEDGNHLQEAWEHILTCLSRIEHLQLLGGEGTPTDTSILSVPTVETDEKLPKHASFQSLKRKGSLQNPAVMAVVRGGSYDSTAAGVNSSGLVTQEQINNFIANLNLLEQIGSSELNHVFLHSQRLNSEAIVAFVKALCKVSITELQSPTKPRVFSLTKLVEIAHYNMNRIRLVWFRIWDVLSDFFVSVGLSENLSVAIFVMDSLRRLAMKFLEREELANYNFQNEFLRPFVIVMQKSNSVEIRELIVRYVSQMVLSRVSSVKSGWKSVFMVFAAAAVDERKNIVLIAFETMEKIVREYFHHVTETDAATFTDCVRCLIKFTNCRFDSDVSLNAISFLRLCAVKLAEGGLVCVDKSSDHGSNISVATKNDSDLQRFADMDVQASFWIPLLLGLLELTSDSRLAIRKSSLELLSNVLKDHGHLFSRTFWIGVFNYVVLPIFNGASPVTQGSPTSKSPRSGRSPWDQETSATTTQSLVDIFISFYDVLRSQLPKLVSVLAGYLKSSIKGPASTGVTAMYRLTVELGSRLTKDEWQEILLAIKEAASATLPGFMKILRTMDDIKLPENSESSTTTETSSEQGLCKDDIEDDNLQTAAYVISKMKSYIEVQLLIMQVITDIYKMNLYFLAAANVKVIVETFSSITSHAQQLNSETALQKKIKKICLALEISEPPWSTSRARRTKTTSTSSKIYCTNYAPEKKSVEMPVTHWILPLGIARKEKMAARTPLLVSALKALSCLERDSCRNYIADIFHLLVDLVRSEHGSTEVQHALSNIFQACIGPIIML
ncbi:Brefeldin A-inhibited guanine nucleotide-exchange protein 4 [Hibiscus syriacus]|uniref:Brefeldin A-inhibited guanine nucleotide-exchange protein 4 n=1 Tax=Hibiscus syriacus TaxID=106335 RepID=A0A6A2Y626_HIBSY|nr:Brefeldin A-inhibited guanine nucleotide-exchange protein 4 [Hibiscus syriacus]